MKARHISLEGAQTPRSAMERIVSVRFAEVLALSGALQGEDPARLHALRIACKRARYALELFNELEMLRAAQRRLKELQDELGVVHDCDVLLALIHESGEQPLAARIERERHKHLMRARFLWRGAFLVHGPLTALVRYAGFGGGAAKEPLRGSYR